MIKVLKNYKIELIAICLLLFLFQCESSDRQVEINPDFLYKNSEEIFVGDSIDFRNVTRGAREFFWKFSDGATSNEKHPRHMFAYGDLFHATLIAKNGNRAEIISKFVEVKSYHSAFSIIWGNGDKLSKGYMSVYPNESDTLEGDYIVDIILTGKSISFDFENFEIIGEGPIVLFSLNTDSPDNYFGSYQFIGNEPEYDHNSLLTAELFYYHEYIENFYQFLTFYSIEFNIKKTENLHEIEYSAYGEYTDYFSEENNELEELGLVFKGVLVNYNDIVQQKSSTYLPKGFLQHFLTHNKLLLKRSYQNP